MYNKENLENKIAHSKNYLEWLKNELDKLDNESIAKTMELIEQAFLDGKKIFIAWNGGSAATASHIASDFQKTTLWKKPQTKNSEFKFKAISLSDNIPVMTAWWNDEWFDYIFSEQLKILWDNWDLLIIITWSWNSWNIIKLVEEARNIWVKTIWFLWFDWGKVKSMLDHHVIVESDNYGFIEDIHMMLDHLITSYFKKIIQSSYV